MPGQLLRETNPAQGYGPALVPQHEDVNGDYKATGEKNPLPVSIEDSGGAAQVDIQYRKQQYKPGLTGQIIPANNTGETAWIDTDGFDKVAFTYISDAASSNTAHVLFSNDNTNIHDIVLNALPTQAVKERGLVVETRARYVKLRIANNDGAAPHTFNAWAYLKV
jgi:hypothetical protein